MFVLDSIIVILLLAIIAVFIFRDEIDARYDDYLYNQAIRLAERRMDLFLAAGYYEDKSDEQFYADFTKNIQYFYYQR